MNIERWVKKNTKIFLWFAIILFSGTLVVSFVPGTFGSSARNEPVGQFRVRTPEGGTEILQVSAREFAPYRAGRELIFRLRVMLYDLSPAYYCGPLRFDEEFLRRSRPFAPSPVDPLIRRLVDGGEFSELGISGDADLHKLVLPPEQKAEWLERAAWETYILNHVARPAVPVVPRGEVLRVLRRLTTRWFPDSVPAEDEALFSVWARLFGNLRPRHVETLVTALLRIARYLELITADVFPSYAEVYRRVLEGFERVRFHYTRVSPDDPRLLWKLRPARLEQIGKFYREHKDRFQSPALVRLLYVSARYKDFESTVPAPKDEELRSFYREHEHEYRSGEQKAPPPFESIRDRVRKDWVRSRLQKRLYDLAWEVWAKINDGIQEHRNEHDGRLPDGPALLAIVERVLKPLRIRGDRFDYSVTNLFPRARLEDIVREEKLGDAAKLRSFLFGSGADPKKDRTGELLNDVVRTDTGCHLFAVYRWEVPKPLPLTRRLEKIIRRRLREGRLVDLARSEAEALVRIINEHGMREAARRRGVVFTATDYFVPATGSNGDGSGGVSDPDLSRAIYEVSRNVKKIGRAGFKSVPTGKGWPRFVVGVLTDRRPAQPASLQERIREMRAGRRLALRNATKQELFEGIVEEAQLEKKGSGGGEPGAPEPESDPSG